MMKNVEDIYALSPMQEFMLLHAISHPNDDVLVDQFAFVIDAAIDVAALKKAWEELIARHTILRTAFIWKEVKAPVQVVRKKVSLRFEVLDWTNEPPRQPQQAVALIKASEKRDAFDLSQAPLLRVSIVRLSSNQSVMVWWSHHLLLDRWCLSPLLAELRTLYDAARGGYTATLPKARPFRDYIAWLDAQDSSLAETFWRQRFADMGDTAKLTYTGACAGGPAQTASIALGAPATRELRQWARENSLTLSTVVQTAWAVVNNVLSASQDIVFGCSSAGRPPGLPGVESMIGCFISNLPVRIQLPGDQSLVWVMRTLLKDQQRQLPYEYLSPGDIARVAGFGGQHQPFDTLMVWLAAQPPLAATGELPLRGLPGAITTAYPLTVWVDDGAQELSLSIRLAAGHECIAPPEVLLRHMLQTLEHIVTDSAHRPLANWPGFQSAPDFQPHTAAIPEALKPSPSVAKERVRPDGREQHQIEPVREMLTAHWHNVLGHDEFSITDSFFDVGGTSMLAAVLHRRIEASLRQYVPMLALYQSPTLDAMVKTVVDADWPLKSEFVFSLSTTGKKLPLYCVASPEVNTTGYALLASRLEPERPVHVVQAPPEVGRVQRISLRALPELSAQYVAGIHATQPTGPIALLGTCSGSQIALEMARQLIAAGREVPFLCILDTWALYTFSRRRLAVRRALARGSYYRKRVADLVTCGPREWLSEITRIAARRRDALASVGPHPVTETVTNFSEASIGPPSGHAPLAAQQPSVTDKPSARDTDLEWLEEFGYTDNDPHLPKYRGHVTVFRRRQQRRWYRVGDATLGWSGQAEQVDVEMLDVREHFSLLREPDVRDVAKLLDKRLAKAETMTTSPGS